MDTHRQSQTTESVLPLPVPGSASLPDVPAPHRGPVYGSRFAIATEHPAASLAGMNVLQRGGNAVDAAIATSAVNVVVKPHYTQLGGDAFALVWNRRTGAVECLNAGGRAPRKATLEQFASGVPARGPRASTVPGLVDAWLELHRRHGSLSLAELLAPAIDLAERGFPVSMRLAGAMTMLAEGAAGLADATAREAFLADGGLPYREGELFRQPELAGTLASIAQDGRAGFYGGRVGKAIADAMSACGGLIDEADLVEPAALWHEPLVTTYRGCTVYEQALPSQGIILLETLNIAEHFPLSDWGFTNPDSIHVLVEATKLAFADCRRYAADPLVEAVPEDKLLSKEHASARAAEIDLSCSKQYAPAPLAADTTSFVVGDETMAVSFIQSIFWPWGSGFVIPGTGILLNNRMLGFSTDDQSPNCLAPGKRAVHTLNTFLATKDGELIVGGGTPGGDFQVQVNLQTIVGVLDWGLDLQSAIDAPRWVTLGKNGMAMESRFSDDVVRDLERRGHIVHAMAPWDATVSRSQVIASRAGGGWAAASDLRGEGLALAE